MLNESADFVWILIAIAGFFLGRFDGIRSEGRYWMKHALEKKYLVKAGFIFKVEAVEEVGGEE